MGQDSCRSISNLALNIPVLIGSINLPLPSYDGQIQSKREFRYKRWRVPMAGA